MSILSWCKRRLLGDDAVRTTVSESFDLTRYDITYTNGEVEHIRADEYETDGGSLTLYERSERGWATVALLRADVVSPFVLMVHGLIDDDWCDTYERGSYQSFTERDIGEVSVTVTWDPRDGVVWDETTVVMNG